MPTAVSVSDFRRPNRLAREFALSKRMRRKVWIPTSNAIIKRRWGTNLSLSYPIENLESRCWTRMCTPVNVYSGEHCFISEFLRVRCTFTGGMPSILMKYPNEVSNESITMKESILMRMHLDETSERTKNVFSTLAKGWRSSKFSPAKSLWALSGHFHNELRDSQ